MDKRESCMHAIYAFKYLFVPSQHAAKGKSKGRAQISRNYQYM